MKRGTSERVALFGWLLPRLCLRPVLSGPGKRSCQPRGQRLAGAEIGREEA